MRARPRTAVGGHDRGSIDEIIGPGKGVVARQSQAASATLDDPAQSIDHATDGVSSPISHGENANPGFIPQSDIPGKIQGACISRALAERQIVINLYGVGQSPSFRAHRGQGFGASIQIAEHECAGSEGLIVPHQDRPGTQIGKTRVGVGPREFQGARAVFPECPRAANHSIVRQLATVDRQGTRTSSLKGDTPVLGESKTRGGFQRTVGHREMISHHRSRGGP